MGVRIDKWLWAARFYKTRSLAQAALEAGKVMLNDLRPKPAREVVPGDRLAIRNEGGVYLVTITGLAEKRGSAVVAKGLYLESPESVAARAAEVARRQLFAEPAQQIFARPTKRDRRSLETFKRGQQ